MEGKSNSCEPVALNAMRVREAARYLGVGVSTLHRWRAEGRISAGHKLTPRCRVWLKSELDDFVVNAGADAGKGVGAI